METTKHYSNEELQEVMDNTFRGDLNLFQAHLKICSMCQKQFEAYAFIKTSVSEEESASLETSIAIKKAWKIVQRERYNCVFDSLQYWGVVGTCGAMIIFCIMFLNQLGFGVLPTTLTIVFIGMYLLISYKEIVLTEEHYQEKASS